MELADDMTEAVSRPKPEGIGAFLKTRRLALGLTHTDIGNAVKASARRIQALEEERWSELPDGPFLRGFLRNVARALDLDAGALTERVDASLMQDRAPDSILVGPSTPHGMLPSRSGPLDGRHGGRTWIIGAFLFAVIAALIAWSGTDSFDRSVNTARALVQSSSPVSSQPLPTVSRPMATSAPREPVDVPTDVATAAASAPVPSPPQPMPEAVPPLSASASGAASTGALAFHFDEESWVEVRAADGRVVMTGLNPAGSDQQVDGQTPLLIVVGNAKGVELRFRGQPVDLVPYTRGDQVARFTLP